MVYKPFHIFHDSLDIHQFEYKDLAAGDPAIASAYTPLSSLTTIFNHNSKQKVGYECKVQDSLSNIKYESKSLLMSKNEFSHLLRRFYF